MTRTQTLTVELPVELVAQVQEAVERGDFQSQDEAVAAALSAWSRGDQFVWLGEAWQETDIEAGPTEPMEEAMDRLKAKYTGLYGTAAERRKCA